ncbi:ferredoxin [Streptomyces sp. NPDC091281]|uniref:ferredoxin n=1 Tax=Streptomyces sp. NPDC091281 TaxID=3365985 RepID=UPI00381F4326
MDRSLCVGSGQCLHHAPGGFRLDTARRSRALTPDTRADERLLEAAESCPVEAIVITLAESGEAVFPPEEE